MTHQEVIEIVAILQSALAAMCVHVGSEQTGVNRWVVRVFDLEHAWDMTIRSVAAWERLRPLLLAEART